MVESVAAELISWTSPMSEEEAQERIKRAQETQAQHGTINFAILNRPGDALMGWIGFWQEEDGRVFTGYWLGPPFQRQGLLIEAARLALPIALRFFAVEQIWARVRPTHLPSIKVLDRLGFVRAGEADGLVHFVLSLD